MQGEDKMLYRRRTVTMGLAGVAAIALTGCGGGKTRDDVVQTDDNRARQTADNTYDEGTIIDEAKGFFGQSTEAVAKVIEKVFADLGRPNAYIAGEELSAALVGGLRYGDGELHHKLLGEKRVYWAGPSIGFDVGANGAKTFVLVYNLYDMDEIYQRFPGVEGSFYFIGGVGVNYQQSGDIILAPIRLGVGLRAGANVGYLHYTKNRNLLPF
jgi:hypothetical protein